MSRRTTVALVVLAVSVCLAEGVVGLAVLDPLLRAHGGAQYAGLPRTYVPLLVGVVLSVAVGSVVALQQPRHPVGWLFLLLGDLILAAAVIDNAAVYLALLEPHPAGPYLAWVADREWLPWLVCAAMILFLTPDGRFAGRTWRVLGLGTLGCGALALLFSVPSTAPMDAPFRDVESPFAWPAVQPALDWVRWILVMLVGVGLIASAVSLLVRFRHSRGLERRRLLWLAVMAVPAPIFVVGAYGGSMADNDVITMLSTGALFALLPLAAGLSVLRYRLYDVDRVLTATLTYALLSVVLVGVYAVVVWAGAVVGRGWGADEATSATIGAIGAAAIAAPLRGGLQQGLDRRFNRRSFEARRVVRSGLAEQGAGVDLVGLFRDALADPSVTVAFPSDAGWVTPDGSPAPRRPHAVEVERDGRVVAAVGFDPSACEVATVHQCAQLAATELDNARLRAELSRRVEDVAASRRRLAGAQRRERRRIERDLHDGAQQTLLALAFQLQSAQLNGDPDRMREALTEGAESARDAVRELRALANGLHPAALEDGGLTAALEELARHSSVPLRLDVTEQRVSPGLEFTAWLVVCEAVVNAQKHARASYVDVGVRRENGHLVLRVADDGVGGAQADGSGLRGMRDRVDTAGGTLSLASGEDGTTVEARLPCGS